jgi:hypothetical protein
MSNGFDGWSGPRSDVQVILRMQPMTAIYSDAGRVVICQQGAAEQSDRLVFFNPQGAMAAAWALMEQAHLVGLPEASGSLMGDSEFWPPETMRFEEPHKVRPRYSDCAGAEVLERSAAN